MSSSLVRLRFIHCAAWIAFGDLPGAKRAGWRPRPSMIFISDYDGDLTEYLAAFGLALTRSMNLAFGSYEGFPGSRPTRGLIDYVERSRSVELLRYSAYPGVTVTDIEAAVEVGARIDELRKMGDDADESRFVAAYQKLTDALALAPAPVVPSFVRGLWLGLRGWWNVAGLTVAMPIEADRTDEVVAGIGELASEGGSVFEQVGGVHFARLATIEVVGRDSGSAGAVRGYLLFTTWFDGDLDDFVERLVTGLGARADTLWGCCEGYPGTANPRTLAAWVIEHRLPFSMFVDSRAGMSVERMRAALDLRERAFELVTVVQEEPVSAIRQELKSLWS